VNESFKAVGANITHFLTAFFGNLLDPIKRRDALKLNKEHNALDDFRGNAKATL